MLFYYKEYSKYICHSKQTPQRTHPGAHPVLTMIPTWPTQIHVYHAVPTFLSISLKNTRPRESQRDLVTATQPQVSPKPGMGQPEARSKDSLDVSHMGGGDSSSWGIIRCLPDALAESQKQEETGLNPGFCCTGCRDPKPQLNLYSHSARPTLSHCTFRANLKHDISPVTISVDF